MSRWLEVEEVDGNRRYVETLADVDKCKWLVNEICCNNQYREIMGNFPYKEHCGDGKCSWFAGETDDDIERLRNGVSMNAE